MKLDTNSWHFKLVKHMMPSTALDIRYNKRVSLCNYFWLVAWAIFAATVMTLFAASLFGAVLYVLVVAPVAFLFGATWALNGAGVGLVVWASIACGVLFEYAYRAMQRRKRRPVVAKEPSLLGSYIQAKKDKFCPLLVVEE